MLERILAGLLYTGLVAVIGWLASEVKDINEKREAGHNEIIELLHKANDDLTTAINDVKVRQERISTILEVHGKRLDANPTTR